MQTNIKPTPRKTRRPQRPVWEWGGASDILELGHTFTNREQAIEFVRRMMLSPGEYAPMLTDDGVPVYLDWDWANARAKFEGPFVLVEVTAPETDTFWPHWGPRRKQWWRAGVSVIEEPQWEYRIRWVFCVGRVQVPTNGKP